MPPSVACWQPALAWVLGRRTALGEEEVARQDDRPRDMAGVDDPVPQGPLAAHVEAADAIDLHGSLLRPPPPRAHVLQHEAEGVVRHQHGVPGLQLHVPHLHVVLVPEDAAGDLLPELLPEQTPLGPGPESTSAPSCCRDAPGGGRCR
jgi:hypothetical protein